MSNTFRVLMLGDISGESGMGEVFLSLPSFIKKTKCDVVIANGENASGGFGLTLQDYDTLKRSGVDVITSGNHIWQKEEIFPLLDTQDDILRPLNYPEPCVGKGYTIKRKGDTTYAVINVQGRYDMYYTDDPYKRMESIVRTIRKTTPLIYVDCHAENTEEKEALSFFLDGSVTAFVGTHTHVQTRDEKILPKGTAYITDLGLTGVLGVVIGSDPEKAIQRQLTQIPLKSEVASGKAHTQGVMIDADKASGRALSIERFTLQ